MATTYEVREMLDSKRLVTGVSDPGIELHYKIIARPEPGVSEDYSVHDARDAMLDKAPETHDLFGDGLVMLPRGRVTCELISHFIFEGTVHYSYTPQVGSSSYTFDTGGGTHHITQSLATVASYPPTPDGSPDPGAPDHQGAIGVSEEGEVAGVDIVVPVYRWTETHVLPSATVTSAYKGILHTLTGRVNDAPFKDLAAGEVLFEGASGSRRGGGDWEIAFRFAASPNITNMTIGSITGINKAGWDYLWVKHQTTTGYVAIFDGSKRRKTTVTRPKFVYVEQVYEKANLSLLGI